MTIILLLLMLMLMIMAAGVTKFIPEIWSGETQRLMDESYKTSKPIYSTFTDYTPITKGAKAGGYNGPLLARPSALPLPIDDADFKELTKGNFNMPFDQEVGVPVLIKDIVEAQSILAIRQTYTGYAKDALEDFYSLYMVMAAIDGCVSANRLTLEDEVNNVITLDDFIKADEILTAQKAPKRNRYCVIGSTHNSQLYKIPEFISRDKIANAQAIPDAVIGRLLGFDIMVLPDMPKVDNTGDVDDAGILNVALFYHSTSAGFGRNKEFGAREESKAGIPGVLINVWSAFGGKVHPDNFAKRIVTIRDNESGD